MEWFTIDKKLLFQLFNECINFKLFKHFKTETDILKEQFLTQPRHIECQTNPETTRPRQCP